MRYPLLLFVTMLCCGCDTSVDRPIADRNARTSEYLDRIVRADEYPGIQYVVVDPSGIEFEYAGGWADVEGRIPMRSSTTMMAYSMTKTFTAAAVLQLAEQGKLSLDDRVSRYLPSIPYDRSMTVRHLLSQTSGIPDPIPLRWAHLAGEHASFDENLAFERTLEEHPAQEFPPGSRYAYSNISYWILGKIVEKASGEPYPEYMREKIFSRLGIAPDEAGYAIPDLPRHAKGYLKKYSFMNLVKGFLVDDKFVGEYEGGWLHLNNHHLNGPGFGGLIATPRSVAAFLRDQLTDTSVLFSAETKKLYFTQQRTNAGEPIEMTLGWHIHEKDGVRYYYKEGGGGGYHAEMRIYPGSRIGTVIMVNETSSRCTDLQNELDKEFIAAGGS